MGIFDKTGKSSIKLINGWCLKDGRITFSSPCISESEFWFSLYFSKDITVSNIAGKTNNTLTVVSNTLIYTENGNVILAGEFDSSSQSRLTLYREAYKVKIYQDYKLILNAEELSEIISDTNSLEISFSEYIYDIRIANGKSLKYVTDNYSNETVWLPIQEGYEIDLHDVVGSSDAICTGTWESERKYSFYNQIYGFTLTNDVLVPNSFFGIKDKKIIYDDGNTWIRIESDYLNKKATVWNTENLPLIYNSNIYLSVFYLENVLRDDFCIWNIKELYKKVFDEYIDSSALVSFYSKRFLGQDDLPTGLNEILFYNRKIYTLEENYLYAYLLNDDRNDRKENYVTPDPNAIHNVSYGDGNIVILDDDYFLLHEQI